MDEIIRLEGTSWAAKRNVDGRGRATYPIDLLLRPRDYGATHVSRRTARPRRAPMLSRTLLHAMLSCVVYYIKTAAPSTSANVVLAFIHFERFLHDEYRWVATKRRRFSIGDLTSEVFSAYGRYIEGTSPSSGRYGSFLRCFYLWGVRNSYSGFDFQQLRKISQIPFHFSKVIGRVARFRDPIKGALIWEEEQQIISALEADFGNRRDRSVVATFYETGIRPEAAGRIRLHQLEPTPRADTWLLRVPKVKKGIITRATFDCDVTAKTASLLLALNEGQPQDGFLFHWISSDLTTKELRDAVARWAREADLRTNRIAPKNRISRLPLTPSRFRRTIATNMADRGATPEEIAAALDDESIAMAAVYAATSSSIVDVLAATLDRHPAWFRLLDLFAGRIAQPDDVRSLPEVFGGVPHFHGFASAAAAIGSIGHCSLKSPCPRRPPLSCYRCPYFLAANQPARHEHQLAQLKDEIDANVGVESDRMAAVLLPTMAAILSLIARLRAERGLAPVGASASGKAAKAIFRRSTKPSRGGK